jgi:hypothetical protein
MTSPDVVARPRPVADEEAQRLAAIEIRDRVGRRAGDRRKHQTRSQQRARRQAIHAVFPPMVVF